MQETESREHPSAVRAWVEAMRLRTLPVSVAGVVAGCGCAAAAGSFRWIPALICLAFAVMSQIISNFANEYFDYRNGLDKPGREGFRRGVTEGDISPQAMRSAIIALLAVDAAVGLTLVAFGGWWLVAVGVAVALFAIAYSAGPYPLSHHGLGDVAVIVFFGLVPVCFTAYVQQGASVWHGPAPLIGLSVGMLAANVLIVNNYRDVEDDRAVGKRTLVVMLGRPVMASVYLLFGLASPVLAAFALRHTLAPGWAAAVVAFIALYVLLWIRLRRSEGAALNPQLGMTAMVLLLFSLLIAVGMAFSV